eukprot:g41889.t1
MISGTLGEGEEQKGSDVEPEEHENMQVPDFHGEDFAFKGICMYRGITIGIEASCSTLVTAPFELRLDIEPVLSLDFVDVSPYLKSLSMVAANKLLHLLEAFSTTWFLFTASQNHHLVFFLLEIFNNIIQYQFDGNSNLVYAIIRKRNVFHQLANLPTDPAAIQKALQKKKKSTEPISRTNSQEGVSMEGSRPAAPAEPGTLKTSLIATPGIDKLTEKSQVSEDGTLSRVDQGQGQTPSPAGNCPAPLASDTESSSA